MLTWKVRDTKPEGAWWPSYADVPEKRRAKVMTLQSHRAIIISIAS
jgi:hypothetical protein